MGLLTLGDLSGLGQERFAYSPSLSIHRFAQDDPRRRWRVKTPKEIQAIRARAYQSAAQRRRRAFDAKIRARWSLQKAQALERVARAKAERVLGYKKQAPATQTHVYAPSMAIHRFAQDDPRRRWRVKTAQEVQAIKARIAQSPEQQRRRALDEVIRAQKTPWTMQAAVARSQSATAEAQRVLQARQATQVRSGVPAGPIAWAPQSQARVAF